MRSLQLQPVIVDWNRFVTGADDLHRGQREEKKIATFCTPETQVDGYHDVLTSPQGVNLGPDEPPFSEQALVGVDLLKRRWYCRCRTNHTLRHCQGPIPVQFQNLSVHFRLWTPSGLSDKLKWWVAQLPKTIFKHLYWRPFASVNNYHIPGLAWSPSRSGSHLWRMHLPIQSRPQRLCHPGLAWLGNELCQVSGRTNPHARETDGRRSADTVVGRKMQRWAYL